MFTNNISGVESLNKSEPSVDWREELKNSNTMETMAGYTIGMPGHKEPEEKVEEPQEEVPLENKWAKAGKNWGKINFKPATRHIDSRREKSE